jgi:murein DD-endopeptidase MepM/ murein hydrolase activator NlpD
MEHPSADETPLARKRRPWIAGIATTTAIVGLTLFGASSTQKPRTAAAAGAAPSVARPRPSNWDQVAVPEEDREAVEDSEPAEIVAEVAVEPAPLPELPMHGDEPITEWYPTLLEWVHPVPGSPDIVPHQPSRFFGAKRTGHEQFRSECGGGHCGVDLVGTRGQPVVAVAWGIVVRVQNDADRIGGRYVRIEHPDFVYTSYFHLDRIAPGLKVGDEVDPGQPVGELGKSGIHISMPHLHFALELAEQTGGPLRFVDPVPFLARAEVLPRDAVPDFPKPADDDDDDAAAEVTPSEGPGEP